MKVACATVLLALFALSGELAFASVRLAVNRQMLAAAAPGKSRRHRLAFSRAQTLSVRASTQLLSEYYVHLDQALPTATRCSVLNQA
jgi:hypothetical protein